MTRIEELEELVAFSYGCIQGHTKAKEQYEAELARLRAEQGWRKVGEVFDDFGHIEYLYDGPNYARRKVRDDLHAHIEAEATNERIATLEAQLEDAKSILDNWVLVYEQPSEATARGVGFYSMVEASKAWLRAIREGTVSDQEGGK